jgi:hypothetical protein
LFGVQELADKKPKKKFLNYAIRNALKILPKEKRLNLYRNMISVSTEYPKELKYKLAETKEELEAALKILHDEYVRSGYMDPHPSGMRVTPYHALPSTSTLIATWNNEVVATISIIRSNPFGLPLEKIYDLDPIKQNGARLAEISSLAIKKGFQGDKGLILFPLLKFLYNYCVDFFGVDYMLIAVNPNRIEFYEALMFFKRLDEKNVVDYDFVNGAPAVGGYLCLRDAYNEFAFEYGKKKTVKNLFNFFVERKFSNIFFPDRRYFQISDPFLNPEMLDYFFNEKTDVFKSMSDHEISILRYTYRDESYLNVIPDRGSKATGDLVRLSTRYEVKCQGRIILSEDKYISLNILDISGGGFAATLDFPVRFGTKLTINIAIGEFKLVTLIAHPVWKNDESTYGFKIIKSCDEWKSFTSHLSGTKFKNKYTNEFVVEYKNGLQVIAGRIDENSDMKPLIENEDTPQRIIMGQISEMNSYGIKKWIGFIDKRSNRALELHECPMMFINTVAMIPTMVSKSEDFNSIKSLKLEYHCDNCYIETPFIVPIKNIKKQYDEIIFEDKNCSKCNALLLGEGLYPENYAFLLNHNDIYEIDEDEDKAS